jgi:hypothetical protein
LIEPHCQSQADFIIDLTYFATGKTEQASESLISDAGAPLADGGESRSQFSPLACRRKEEAPAIPLAFRIPIAIIHSFIHSFIHS